jgi:hypothetical protein
MGKYNKEKVLLKKVMTSPPEKIAKAGFPGYKEDAPSS